MNTTLHVVYREERTSDGQTSWYSYSYPDGVYAASESLSDLREQFRDVLSSSVGTGVALTLVEHVERAVAPGVFVRVAVDRETLDREYVASSLRVSFDQPAHRPDIGQFITSGGDAVVVCCLAADPLAWVFEQMSDEDAVYVAMAVSEIGVCHSAIAGPGAVPPLQVGETLGDLGFDASSTVGEFLTAMTADAPSHPRPVVLTS